MSSILRCALFSVFFCCIYAQAKTFTDAQHYLDSLINADGTVTLGPDTFITTNTLNISRSNSILQGSEGTLIIVKGAGIKIRARGCQVKNITIDGNCRDCTPNHGSKAIDVLPEGKDCLIEMVTIRNTMGSGICMEGAEHTSVTHCTIENTGGNGIICEKVCKNIVISDNSININRFSENADNIFVRGDKKSNDPGSSDIVIRNNVCSNSRDFGIEVGDVFYNYHQHIAITHNVVTEAKNAGISFRSVNDGIIDSNTITNCGCATYGADGIFITGDFDVNEKVRIIANTIKARNGCRNGIRVTNYKDVLVADNTISNAENGIYFEGESGRTVLSSTADANTITAVNAGIRICDVNGVGIRDVSLTNNKINNCRCGIEAASGHPNPKHITVTENQIANTAKQGIVFFSVDSSSITRNVLTDCPDINDNTYYDRVSVSISSCSAINVADNTIGGLIMKGRYGVRNSKGITITDAIGKTLKQWQNQKDTTL
jgi:parallel beta-helix repeat protein